MARQVLRLSLTVSQKLEKLRKRVTDLRDRALTKLPDPAKAITIQMLKAMDMPFAASARGQKPRNWRKHAPLTAFIRRHRAAKNRSVNSSENRPVLVDTGELRVRNVPIMPRKTKNGIFFGVENRDRRAAVLNFGGVTRANRVRIAAFKRKSKGGGTHRVRAYNMKIGGGKRIPARPWLPTVRVAERIAARVMAKYAQELQGLA